MIQLERSQWKSHEEDNDKTCKMLLNIDRDSDLWSGAVSTF